MGVAAIGAAFVPVLRRFHRGLAYGHFAVRILESLVILGIGVHMLAEHNLVNYEPIIYVFTGTAGLMFATVLLRTGLVARWLARLGVIGYIAILAALPVDLLNVASLDTFPGMLLYAPGGVFELVLPLVLITRGFRRTDAPTVHVADPPEPARRRLAPEETTTATVQHAYGPVRMTPARGRDAGAEGVVRCCAS